MRRRKFFITKLILISILIVLLIVMKMAFSYLSGYLASSEHVKANVLVVEGWLTDHSLELVRDEFNSGGYERIVTTGLKTSNAYRRIAANGFSIFHPDKEPSEKGEPRQHTFQIDIYSEIGGDNRAHFNFYLNDSLAGNFLTEPVKKIYTVSWFGNLNEIDSMRIEFDNDRWGELGDRNLIFKEIIIDQEYTYPNIKNPSYIETDINGRRVITNFYSNSGLAKDQLRQLGIDSSKITAVAGEKVRINRTLTSALAFRDWTKTTKMDIKGVNIISYGAHARRTWMIYNKILNEKYSIGIISLPDRHFNNSKKYKLFKTVRETLGIIYYWFILILY